MNISSFSKKLDSGNPIDSLPCAESQVDSSLSSTPVSTESQSKTNMDSSMDLTTTIDELSSSSEEKDDPGVINLGNSFPSSFLLCS